MLSPYLRLKLAWELFQKPPENLEGAETRKLEKIARQQGQIEQKVLGSPEAAQVVIPETTLTQRLGEIRQRYASDEEMQQDLERQGLDEEQLAASIIQDLRIEAVLERVANSVLPATLTEAEIFYRLHPAAFDRPPSRRLRHILITFDHAKEKRAASEQLEKLRGRLTTVEDFAQAALRYSQCPTAMEGGQLGVVKHGQLFAELEAAAFALDEGHLSAILESPMGLHLLRCDEILPSGLLAFEAVSHRIIERLTDQRRREAQSAWIKAL